MIDFIIVTPLAFVIGFEKAVLTLIMLFIASKVINFILEGFNPRKAIMIISDKYNEIGQRIQTDLGSWNYGVGWTWLLLKRETTSVICSCQSSTIDAGSTNYSRV